jgi:hypothetical protein
MSGTTAAPPICPGVASTRSSVQARRFRRYPEDVDLAAELRLGVDRDGEGTEDGTLDLHAAGIGPERFGADEEDNFAARPRQSCPDERADTAGTQDSVAQHSEFEPRNVEIAGAIDGRKRNPQIPDRESRRVECCCLVVVVPLLRHSLEQSAERHDIVERHRTSLDRLDERSPLCGHRKTARS